MCFPVNFARFFRTPILHMIIVYYAKRCSKKLTKFTAKFMLTAASGISENRPYLPAANLLMFCRTDCKSVYKVLSLSTEM